MSIENKQMGLKAKLGLDVFKESNDFHIHVVEGKEKEAILQKLALVCPAGLYSNEAEGEISICVDGCLECGTCRIAAGVENLDWTYPLGGSGVQFRFG